MVVPQSRSAGPPITSGHSAGIRTPFLGVPDRRLIAVSGARQPGQTRVRIVMHWQSLERFSFGDHPALAGELVRLVLEGKKRATCWAVSERLKGAAVGKPMVALDGENRARVVLKTIELTQHQFDQVDE